MDFFLANYDRILASSGRHLEITAICIALALAIGIPLGIVAAKVRWLTGPLLALASLIYTVPTLAMFGLMIPVLGLGLVPALTAITLYSLLPVVQNTYAGLGSVPADVREAATGIGMGSGQLLLRVELPIALVVIMAGARISAVNAVGLATLASLIGAGGLGDFIFRGISTVSLAVVMAGSLPVIMMAVVADVAMKGAERRIALRMTGHRAPADPAEAQMI